MTRLLVPDMFGVMAIATVLIAGLAMFSDLGVRQSIIQSSMGAESTYLNTAWVVQIARGGVLCLATLAISILVQVTQSQEAFPVESAYADQSLPLVIAALSISTLIQGFESTKLIEIVRTLAIHRLIRIDITSQLVGFACMVGWVYLVDRSVFALVAGTICASLFRTLLSHHCLSGTPNRFVWDREAFTHIIGFGKWVFVASILGYFVNNGDRLILGGLIAGEMLGIYAIAYLLANAIEVLVSKVIGDVAFPALSEIARERPQDLRTAYYRLYRILASLVYLCAGALMLAGEAIVSLLYDARYHEAGWMLEILAVGLIALPVRLATHVFLALGKPKALSNIIAMRLTTLFLLTPLGFYLFGVPGALWGIVLSTFASVPMTLTYMARYHLLDAKKDLLMLPMILVGMLFGKGISLVLA